MRFIVSLSLGTTLLMSAYSANTSAQAVIGTHVGRGADATIANDQSDGGDEVNQFFADDALGAAGAVEARMFVDDIFLSTIRHRVGLFRFDLAGLSGDVSDAHLEFHSIGQGRTLDFFALNDSDEATENWDEAAITYNTAPGLMGPPPFPTSYVRLDPSAVTEIGSWVVPGPNSGDGFPVNYTVVSQPTPAGGAEPGKVYDDTILPDFSTNLATAIETDTNNLLTILMIHTGADDPEYGGNNGNVTVLSKEGLVEDMAAEMPVGYFFNPSLVLPNAIIAEPQGLAGDYNDDGAVDAADYTVWRDALGGSVALHNEGEDVTPGMVTGEDYIFWKESFGGTAAANLSAAAVPVPEPASVLLSLLAAASWAIAARRRPERSFAMQAF